MTEEREEEWGPWVEHDGRGCPVPAGARVMVLYRAALGGMTEPTEVVAMSKGGGSWDWSKRNECAMILRYRLRRPTVLQHLRDMIADVKKDATNEKVGW